jgi:hypothetical protein
MSELARRVDGDAEIRSRYESVQRQDEAIAAAFHDVPVPPGLEERLLFFAGVAPQLTEQRPLAGASSIGGSSISAEVRSRRRVAPYAAAVSAALVLLVAVAAWAIIHWLPRPLVPLDALIQRALAWTEQSQVQPWNDDLSAAPLKSGYPLDSALRATPRQWRRFSAEGDTVVAYGLNAPGQPFAAQFTIRTMRQHNVPVMLPSRPLSTTGGFCIGACQRNGVLYVLVVEGDASQYRRFVRPQLPVT